MPAQVLPTGPDHAGFGRGPGQRHACRVSRHGPAELLNDASIAAVGRVVVRLDRYDGVASSRQSDARPVDRKAIASGRQSPP